MKQAIILGARSDIARDLASRLSQDGWRIASWARGTEWPNDVRWDLCLIAIGQVHPVGWWWDNHEADWDECVATNLIDPVRLLRYLWAQRNPNAYACFMAGSSPQKIMDGYSAYNASKMGMLKVVEQLDHETKDATIFALGPGYIPTKIHKATLEAKWPNERIARGDGGTPLAKVYECLKWCLSQTKEVVGGRDICVSDMRADLAERLRANPAMFKLRRVE